MLELFTKKSQKLKTKKLPLFIFSRKCCPRNQLEVVFTLGEPTLGVGGAVVATEVTTICPLDVPGMRTTFLFKAMYFA